MSTKHPGLFAALAAPFEPHEVKARATAGRQLHYITARTVMNRLDAVVGPENWRDEYHTGGESSIVCRLSLRLPDGEWLTKCDAGGFAGMADSGDDDKSGYSDAFKRAAVKFGVARYLYRDGVPTFVQERTPEPAAIGTDENGRPSPVSTPCPERPRPVPRPAEPKPASEPSTLGWVHEAPAVPAKTNGHSAGNAQNGAAPPRTGKQLFGWAKDQEQRYEVGLIKYLNQWGKLQDFPGRMVDWDAEMVARAHDEASRKLQSLQTVGTGA